MAVNLTFAERVPIKSEITWYRSFKPPIIIVFYYCHMIYGDDVFVVTRELCIRLSQKRKFIFGPKKWRIIIIIIASIRVIQPNKFNSNQVSWCTRVFPRWLMMVMISNSRGIVLASAWFQLHWPPTPLWSGDSSAPQLQNQTLRFIIHPKNHPTNQTNQSINNKPINQSINQSMISVLWWLPFASVL